MFKQGLQGIRVQLRVRQRVIQPDPLCAGRVKAVGAAALHPRAFVQSQGSAAQKGKRTRERQACWPTGESLLPPSSPKAPLWVSVGPAEHLRAEGNHAGESLLPRGSLLPETGSSLLLKGLFAVAPT